jgi:hypothetical protein
MSTDIHLDPKLSLKSKIFVESLLPELLRALDLERVRGAGYTSILSCILANLIKAGDRRVIVRLGDHVQYKGLSHKQLRRTLPAMAELGWVDLELGKWRGDASTIARKIDLAGLETTKADEAVVVKKKGKPVNCDPYFTQDEIGGMKTELRELNSFLSSADITWVGPSYESPNLSEKEVHRTFNVIEGMYEDDPSADYAGFGRLYDAFWIGMKKAQRANIRIEGERVSYLDFDAMNVRLAYFLAGELPPPGDLYDLTGFLCGYENTYEWRTPFKKFASSIWFAQRGQWPKDIWFPGDEKKKRRFQYRDVYRAFVKKHPILKKSLTRHLIGFQMARLESDIMVDILLRLKGLGIVGLPIHDGLLVKQSQATLAGEILDQVTLERLGFMLPHKTKLLEPKPEPIWSEDEEEYPAVIGLGII